MIKKIQLWIRAIRAPFITSTVISGILGAIVAWYDTGLFNWGYFWLTLAGIFLANTGVNLANDYFDHTSGLDEINKTPTQFSGGSRVIQEKLIPPKTILFAALISFFLTGIIGLYLNYKTPGNMILYIGIFGIFIGYFYTAPPLKLGYTPLGELITGTGCGPVIALGAYCVQAQKFSWLPVLASIPIAITGALILYINEFQDYEADKKIGKRTLVILLGKQRAIKIFFIILGAVYAIIILQSLFGIYPFLTLVTLITIPLYIKIIKIANKNYNKIDELLPANGMTIALHLITALLISGSFLLDKLIQ